MLTVTLISQPNDEHAAQLARALDERGDSVHALNVPTPGQAPPLSEPASPRDTDAEIGEAARELAGAWEREDSDISACHGLLAGVTALVAQGTTDRTDSAHGLVQSFDELGTTRCRYLGRRGAPRHRLELERAVSRNADHVIARSTTDATSLYRLGVPRSQVTVVPHAIDLDIYSPAGPVARRTDDMFRLVTVVPPGPLHPYLGIDTTILALQRLPQIELVVAGGPPGEDLQADAEVRRLLSLAERARVADRIHLRGEVPPSDVPPLLRSADCVVSVPSYLPYGSAVLEAMACGRPVVATPVSGQRDTLVENLTGLFVPPRDPQALARAINRLYRDRILLDGYAVAARDRAEIRHNWTRIATETAATYAIAANAGD